MPTIPSGEIHYETHGNGTPVLLVSGLGGVGSYWAPNIPAFSARHQAIVHDHRGTGDSARSRICYSVDQMTDDLVAVMDHLKIEHAHFVGHSTGDAVGQTLAAKDPERLISLTIYASWTKCDPFFRRVFEARRALLTLGGAGAYTRAASVFLYPDWWITYRPSECRCCLRVLGFIARHEGW
jgi:aminoacrylate hydrolase